MLSSFIKVALRNIANSLLSFGLNVVGIGLGVTCFAVLTVFVMHENSYDKFHPNAEDTYRITTYFKRGDQEVKWAITNGGLASILTEKVSQVSDATRLLITQSSSTFTIGDKSFAVKERTGFYASADFFRVFPFKVLAGQDSTMLKEPNSIVLTRSTALKYFGNLDVLGKEIVRENQSEDDVFKITGLLEDVPQNSHMQFDYLISGTTVATWNDQLVDPQKGGYPLYIYFRAHPNSDFEQLKASVMIETKEVYGERMQFPIQRVTDIYYNADNLFEHAETGNRTFVLILGYLGGLILAIALLNYVILATSNL